MTERPRVSLAPEQSKSPVVARGDLPLVTPFFLLIKVAMRAATPVYPARLALMDMGLAWHTCDPKGKARPRINEVLRLGRSHSVSRVREYVTTVW